LSKSFSFLWWFMWSQTGDEQTWGGTFANNWANWRQRCQCKRARWKFTTHKIYGPLQNMIIPLSCVKTVISASVYEG